MGEFSVEMWLVATSEEVPDDAVRSSGGGKPPPRFWLGETERPVSENRDKRGPVGRVFDLFSLRRTAPDRRLPRLDAALEAELLQAFAPRTTDPPFKTAELASFARFLLENRDRYPVLVSRATEQPSASMSELRVEMWLLATAEEVPRDEARKYWNVKESMVDDLIDRTPHFWIGETEVEIPGNRDLRGPVGRVHDLLSFRGTIPDWQLPKLDAALESELLQAFAPRTTDPPFKTIDPASFAQFLSKSRGRSLFTIDRLLEN
jgi:hypothetical protein